MTQKEISLVGPVVAGLFVMLLGFFIFGVAFNGFVGLVGGPLSGLGTFAALYSVRKRESARRANGRT